jgi:hypothetical protein
MRALLTLCAVLAMAGCDTKSSPAPDPGSAPPTTPPLSDPRPAPRPVDVVTDDGVEVGLGDDGSGLAPMRPRRRVNVDQLEAAILEVSGGINWTETRNRDEVNLFSELSATLGKPDYAQSTDEDLEPSILFQKFLDDASRTVCTRMLTADLAARDDPESAHDPVLLIEAGPDDRIDEAPDLIEANLRELLLRFHGRMVPSGHPLLANWTWLYRSTDFVTQDPTQGWLGVCVGLFTHPDFYLY